MAFRYSGTNWAGIDWHTAAPITKLGSQIETLRPGTLPVDGTVASRGHDLANPSSDHKPQNGIVRAIDFGGDRDELVAWSDSIRLSKDSRLKYMIYDGQICSSYWRDGIEPFTWRRYSGSSPHSHHVHLSSMAASDNDLSPWQLEEPDMADHEHTPPAGAPMPDWAEASWDEWVAYSGADPDTATWDFRRYDLGWVFTRVIKPMMEGYDSKIMALDAEILDLKADLSAAIGADLDAIREDIVKLQGQTEDLEAFEAEIREL